MARNPEQEQVAVNFVVNRMSEYHNGYSLSLPEEPDRRATMQNRALKDRIANGMVDNIFRDVKGEPLLTLRPDGVVVPNGATSDEESLKKAKEALMAPPRWPVAK